MTDPRELFNAVPALPVTMPGSPACCPVCASPITIGEIHDCAGAGADYRPVRLVGEPAVPRPEELAA